MTIVAALCCTSMAGVFFAFSAMVMPGLRRADPDTGLAAMRAINVAVVNPFFVTLFLGTAVVSVVAAITGGPWAVAGAALYVLGGLVLTGVYHIPRNNALERRASTDYWAEYLSQWVPWNHVRAALSLLAGIAFVLAATR
ncbi:anthrone oxygenase family protein [Actinosynnema sp. NPDC020468]|uniref:anthrone oxygenase family protein n=1 Tax=Actinosynnema sp. NPDC020468 TaxID=3154488 RepID=UPI00341089C8